MKLPPGLVEHAGARLFGRKDIEIIVRYCAEQAGEFNWNRYVSPRAAIKREILAAFDLEEKE